eukprot:COSAG05_NODE_4177_length_1636_cov_9.391021_2_plen_172_part_00
MRRFNKLFQKSIATIAACCHSSPCSFDSKATTKLNTAAEKASCFAKFGAHKFRSLKGKLTDLPELPGSVQSRASDIPSDDELNTCLSAMKSGKAPGHDGAYIDIYKRCPTCRRELYTLIRQIWAEEKVPEDMVCGTFVIGSRNGQKSVEDPISINGLIILLSGIELHYSRC